MADKKRSWGFATAHAARVSFAQHKRNGSLPEGEIVLVRYEKVLGNPMTSGSYYRYKWLGEDDIMPSTGQIIDVLQEGEE